MKKDFWKPWILYPSQMPHSSLKSIKIPQTLLDVYFEDSWACYIFLYPEQLQTPQFSLTYVISSQSTLRNSSETLSLCREGYCMQSHSAEELFHILQAGICHLWVCLGGRRFCFSPLKFIGSVATKHFCKCCRKDIRSTVSYYIAGNLASVRSMSLH